MSVPERALVAGRAARQAAAGGATLSQGPSPGAREPCTGCAQDAPRGLGAGALLRALFLPLAQVLARHLLHSVLGK